MSDKIEKCPKCQIVITVATITDRGACENCGLDYTGSGLEKAEIVRLRSELSAAKAVIEAAKKARQSAEAYLTLWQKDEKDFDQQHAAFDDMIADLRALASLPPSPSDSTDGGGL